jgi:hypothetical protein
MDTEELWRLDDDELSKLILHIRENISECGNASSYTVRNKPVLKKAKAEARRRKWLYILNLLT